MGGIQTRALNTQQQPEWFNKLRPFHVIYDNQVQYGRVTRLTLEMFAKDLNLKCGFIKADGEIWAVIPEANLKVIVGLNPVKSGLTHQHLAQEEGEWFNKVPEGVFDIGGTSNSSTENMNCKCGVEVRGCLAQLPNHKNYLTYDDEGNYEGLTKTLQKWVEEDMKQYIDNKNVNDERVIDMPKSPDHNDKKKQANDGLFKLCEIKSANIVSLMADAVDFVGNTAALSLRDTKPWAVRIFGNVGAIGGAWGVIMAMTSYLPREFHCLGYVAAVFCALAVLFG